MPKVGDMEFDYTPSGLARAEAYAAETGLRISNAQERSVQSYVDGGRVVEPMVGYEKGGKVKK